MSEIRKDMMKVKPMDLDINGMKSLPDVKECRAGYVEGKIKYFNYDKEK